MPEITYLGGPCAGIAENLSEDALATGRTVCRATTYFLQRVSDETIYAVLPTSGETVVGDAGPGQVTLGPNILTTSSALEGWANLQTAMFTDLSGGLARCRAARRSIRGG